MWLSAEYDWAHDLTDLNEFMRHFIYWKYSHFCICSDCKEITKTKYQPTWDWEDCDSSNIKKQGFFVG